MIELAPSPSVILKRLCCLQAGTSMAGKQSASKQRDRETETAAAKLGLRRGLDMASVSPDSAAELLLTADAMLGACPRAEAAKCARVEVRLREIVSGLVLFRAPFQLPCPVCRRSLPVAVMRMHLRL